MYKSALVVVVALLSACATSTIPITTRMSDTIMMGIKPSQTNVVAYEFHSGIQDGIIKPCKKDTREVQTSHPGFMHSESASLKKMLSDYATMKFSATDAGADTKIKVTLEDFWLEQYSPDSGASQFMAVMGGGEINVFVAANLDLSFEVTKAGSSTTKKVHISTDNTHVHGIGTGTSTSNIYRGEQSFEYKVAETINAANNKAIVILNQFLELNQI